MRVLRITPPTPFAEQDFLNMYFKDIYKPIPLVYNLVLAMLWRHPENVELDKVKVVHYCAAGSKPWRYTGKEENMERDDIKMLVKKWWDIYNDPSLDYVAPTNNVESVNLKPSRNDSDTVEAVKLKPLIAAAFSDADTLGYVTAPSAA